MKSIFDVEPEDKEKFLKELLDLLTRERYALIQYKIELAREKGYDYPELKLIEKSINISDHYSFHVDPE